MIQKIIEYMRTVSGFSQKELAEKLGIAQTTLSGYETQYSQPNYEMAERIAKICNFSIVFIDNENGEQVTAENVDAMLEKPSYHSKMK